MFTDLAGPTPPGLSFSATVDTRYSSSPTPLKMAAMILGVVLTAIALIALHILDTADGTRHRRFLPSRWWSIGALDAVVIAVLVWWHFVGANTSDDGYILTMARVSEHAGYMANYYRWLGTPEAPFGWYYDLLALWAHVSTNSVWMRLPTLVMALTCWWAISREVIPRLGHAVKTNRARGVDGGGHCSWRPGCRWTTGCGPEPIIALGILLTWCSVERAVATNRLLPVAIACIIGALTLFSGPTGIASIGALLVAIGPLRTIIHRRSRQFGVLPLLAPIAAAVTVTVILIFRDQTLAGEMQATALKRALGPSLSWFDEHLRYERLFMASPDGSIARRFAVLAVLLALGITVAMSLRKGRIPGTAAGPSRRIVGITIISFLAMMFTPTKWTHHFGVFAGLAGSLGALAAVAVTSCGDALAPQPHRVRRDGAVPGGIVVRQRQRLVVCLQFRCAMVEFIPGVALRVCHRAARADRAGTPAVGVVPFHVPRQRPAENPHWGTNGRNRSVPVGNCGVAAGDVRSRIADAGDDRTVPRLVGGPVQSGGPGRQVLWTGRGRHGGAGSQRRHAVAGVRLRWPTHWVPGCPKPSPPTVFPPTSPPTR